ncbi:MAG: GH36 C-terminal domain-containing protein [Thermoguttaceae bacterium]|nr:GH36 C-terminal domain-containing protein [Thermoguttaceae bacterium]
MRRTPPSLGSGVDVRVREIDYDSLRRLVGQWRELSRYYYADFYPLTPCTQDPAQWIAWQFHDPERGEGAVQAFRRAKSETGEMRLALHDLKPEATYTLTVFDTPGTSEATGRQLMTEGLHVVLPEKPSAAVVVYRAR